MSKEIRPFSRKKFLSWSIGITSLLAVPAFLRPGKKKKETKTVKMLTQNGQLVMVDVEAIPKQKERIQPKDIHTWVEKKKTSL